MASVIASGAPGRSPRIRITIVAERAPEIARHQCLSLREGLRSGRTQTNMGRRKKPHPVRGGAVKLYCLLITLDHS